MLSNLNNNIKNITKPAMAIIHLSIKTDAPNPTNLLRLMRRSATKEYIVSVLCIQQNWKTVDNANINNVGNNEHPAIVLEKANGIFNTAHIM